MFKLFGNKKIKQQLSADTKKLHSFLADLFLKVDNYALSSANNFLSDNGVEISSIKESMVVEELKRDAKGFLIEQEKLKLLQEDYFSKVSYYPVERNDWKIEELKVHKKELESILRSVYWPSLPYDVEGDFWKFCSSKKCSNINFR